ncbi:hypothetical protein F2P79_025538 [Pimephales promelas]|nr:hypothetical protein F2P79_025538 [Pimephales promelas]
MQLLIWLAVFLWCLFDHGASDVDPERASVSVMEGDSVTLYTGVQTNQQDKIRWYYKDTRIARINGDLSKICTDVQCNEGTEKFRDRLKLDHQTGSLTIMDITNTDAGEYTLKISSGKNESDEIFSVTVRGVSGRDEAKRKTAKEGESVTLHPGVIRKPSGVMTWYFNEILIAEITGDQSQICTDDQCNERFRDRLKLDHQTGSLNITHTTNTHSGEYKLQINSRRFSITKIFSVSVTDSGLSSAALGAICAAVGVAVILLAAAGIYYRHRSKQSGNSTQRDDHDQENAVTVPLKERNGTAPMANANGTSSSVTLTNGISQ